MLGLCLLVKNVAIVLIVFYVLLLSGLFAHIGSTEWKLKAERKKWESERDETRRGFAKKPHKSPESRESELGWK